MIRFLAMLAAAVTTGLLVAVGCGWLLGNMFDANSGGWSGLVGAILGFVIGYPVGVIISQIFARFLFHYRGSLVFGILGAILGTGLVMILAEPLKLNTDSNLMIDALLVVSPLLGTIGFHLRRDNR